MGSREVAEDVDTRPDTGAVPLTDFTIEYILYRAGKRPDHHKTADFEWLQCTRYKPPKLQRSKRKEGVQKRKLGRNPRIPFSASQVAALEERYRQSPYLSTDDVAHLSNLLRLSDTRVKIWFQNRRARERREKLAKGESIQLNTTSNKNEPKKRSYLPTGQPWSAFIPCGQIHTESSSL